MNASLLLWLLYPYDTLMKQFAYIAQHWNKLVGTL